MNVKSVFLFLNQVHLFVFSFYMHHLLFLFDFSFSCQKAMFELF